MPLGLVYVKQTEQRAAQSRAEPRKAQQTDTEKA